MNKTTRTGIMAQRTLAKLNPESLELVFEQQEELKPSRQIDRFAEKTKHEEKKRNKKEYND